MSGDSGQRIGGLICLLVAAGFGWFFILRPLCQTRSHPPQVEEHQGPSRWCRSPRCSACFPDFGESKPDRNVDKPNFIAAGAALAAGGFVFGSFKTKFTARGYWE
jgi:hypothetical protein